LIDSITQMTRLLHLISKYSKNYENVTVTDVTSHYSGLSLIGPASTELLESLTQTFLNVEDFPLNTVKVTLLENETMFIAQVLCFFY
jgi:glycine cleavage system aminomethyltransferase T